MSLLMDALKKAEREREALASEQQGEEGDAPELSLDPMEELAEEIESSASDADAWDLLEDDVDLEQSFDLKLEETNLSLDPDPYTPREIPETPETPENLSEGFDALDDMPLGNRAEESVSLEDTSSTVPSMKAVKASVDRYFDGGASASMSMSMPPVSDDATTVVTRRDADAQAAAQGVFDAKKRRSGSGIGMWLAIIPLFLIAAVGIGLYYWMSITGNGEVSVAKLTAMLKGEPISGQSDSLTSTTVQSTTSATLSESTSQTGTATNISETTGTTALGDDATQSLAATSVEQDQAGTGLGDGQSQTAALEPALSDVLEVEPPASGDLTPAEDLVAAEPDLEIELQPQGPLPTPEELLAAADEAIQGALSATANQSTVRQASGIRVARTATPSRVNPNVMKGYAAFQAGEFAHAETHYRSALRSDRSNRDALLGIAAIAVRKQRPSVAANIYRQLLKLDPRDSVASAGLLALEARPNTPAQESELKLMLEKSPEASHLHFALGNVYAGQARWADAQAAYFEAFRLDSDNANYAYNLAIGLDHLAQRRAAAQYYRRALDLAAIGESDFDAGVVAKRLQSLAQASTQ